MTENFLSYNLKESTLVGLGSEQVTLIMVVTWQRFVPMSMVLIHARHKSSVERGGGHVVMVS